MASPGIGASAPPKVPLLGSMSSFHPGRLPLSDGCDWERGELVRPPPLPPGHSCSLSALVGVRYCEGRGARRGGAPFPPHVRSSSSSVEVFIAAALRVWRSVRLLARFPPFCELSLAVAARARSCMLCFSCTMLCFPRESRRGSLDLPPPGGASGGGDTVRGSGLQGCIGVVCGRSNSPP